ncbi:winged helix-turn-helix transcriptional regulator [Halorientalis sp.]|uniref:winged helix-turn-helix transcriptional regulator n=1 Tax=Halorientalis sp. TaxID=1931229 RepID=UPI00262E3E59|nr:winged helix-turn-helix transcriptional regulator [Halorientalis sp.]
MNSFDSSADSSGVPDYLVESAALLSKKWHPAIVRCVAAGDGLGFSDLENRLNGISAKVLTDALEELRDHQILDRTEVRQEPLRVDYTLTERGQDFAAVIDSLADWGEQYLAPDDEEQVVLVAEDDRRIAEMHTVWLEDEYTVHTAHDGEEALRELDTGVDVVVLDRRMPGLSGDEVLDWIRSQGYDCRVALVTSEEPDLDAVALGFDEYVAKPILKDDLRAVVSDLFDRAEYDREVRQFLALQAKLAVLEAENPEPELAASEEYSRLEARLEDAREQVDEDDDIEAPTLDRLGVDPSR